MPRPHVLVTTRIPTVVLDRLREHFDIDYRDGSNAMPRDEFLTRLRGKDGALCVLGNRLDAEAFDTGLPALKIAANIAVGFDNIDVPAARSRGIVVTNTPDVLTGCVADLTIGLILAITRRLVEGDRLIRAGGWTGWALDFMLGPELRGQQLGIVGYGRIGRAVAARARAFGMRIASARPPEDEPVGPEDVDATPMPFHELLASSDVVSVHVPLTAKTRGMIGQRELAMMKPTAYLVNTARGPVVDEAALAVALRDRRIAGAALDVFEREPEVHPGLLDLDNVVLIPHLGSATVETRTAMADLAARNVIEVLAGRAPLTPIP
jgi:glyoxylate reductase